MHDHNIPSIADANLDLEGTYVLVRSPLNVPVEGGKVANAFRLKQALQTIEFLREKKARVILISHIGREAHETLAPVFEALREYIPLSFCPQVTGEQPTSLRNSMHNGDVLLLENLRQDTRETENEITLAQELAALADVYVNDDFAASHRAHASLSAICALLPSYAGLSFLQEYTELSKVMSPKHPALFILGGAKFETKMPLVEKYLDIYDDIFIGGALANDFFKAKGYEVGDSLVSDASLGDSALLSHPKIKLPVDVVVVKNGVSRVTTPDAILPGEMILDVGPKSIESLESTIMRSHTILWNGPMGNYEHGYPEQTLALARLITSSDAYTVVGGGDTVAAIESLGLNEAYGFLSTAGGAMLTFLEMGTLPALEALQSSHR